MTWTTDKPTQDGYYWIKTSIGEPAIFSVDGGWISPSACGRRVEEEDGKTLWYGPLQPPSAAPTRYEAFVADLRALCKMHGVGLATSGYDTIVVSRIAPEDAEHPGWGNPIWQDRIEDGDA